MLLAAMPLGSATAAQSRLWRPEERSVVADVHVVTAVAASRAVVYAATPRSLAVYDRSFRTLRRVVTPLEGYPGGVVLAMAADPSDDTAWLGLDGRWMSWQPFGDRWESGALPGVVEAVVLDARDPSRGAYFATTAGWYFVRRGGIMAERASPPAPGSRTGSLTMQELRARLPSFDAVRLRVERDELLRQWRITSAALVPGTNEVILGTNGNGVFQVDPVTYFVQRFAPGLVGDVATSVAAGQGMTCVGTALGSSARRFGISCLDGSGTAGLEVESVRNAPLPGNRVHRLLVRERAVWAATDAGVLRVDRRRGEAIQVGTLEGMPADLATALASADVGVWVGTLRGLVLVSDTGRTVVAERTIASDAVYALLARGDTLWVGTESGLYVLPPLAEALVHVAAGELPREPVVALAGAGERLLAVTVGRMALRDGGAWRLADQPGPVLGRLTSAVADGRAFYLSGERGVARWDPAEPGWRAFTETRDVPQPVYDVAVTRDRVWAATPLGLVGYDKRLFEGR